MNEPKNLVEETKDTTVEPNPTPEVVETVVETTEVMEKNVSTPEVTALVAVADEVIVAETTSEPNPTPEVEETVVETTEAVEERVDEVASPDSKKFLWKYYVAAGLIVVITLGALVFVMEKQGRINTGIFSGVEQLLAQQKAVAKVNDSKISQYDLSVSVAQIATGAQAQGADVSSPEVQEQIQAQAIDMLVNTELLKQEAKKRNIEITDEAVNARLEQLKTDVGGEEILAERMKEFGIDNKTLLRDIKNELTIQSLLEAVFVEKNIQITEEEVAAIYEAAGGAEAELPPIDEVRDQIEAQIRGTKEQEAVTAFIEELRKGASIQILI